MGAQRLRQVDEHRLELDTYVVGQGSSALKSFAGLLIDGVASHELELGIRVLWPIRVNKAALELHTYII